ncbi:MAG TPA: 30S ribosomal protein S8 [Candidatus Saccharimonadales bacterium]|nr:30S ribosomal protein S8 [Candidatus Saccharimonadales bacterium]
MNYTIGDFIIRIKNAVMAHRKTVDLPYSKLCKAVGQVLVKEKFLTQIKEEEIDGKKKLVAHLAYDKRIAAFTDVRLISKPSLRVYSKASDQSKLRGRGIGKIIVSTSKGIMTGQEAVKQGIGGELLFKVW